MAFNAGAYRASAPRGAPGLRFTVYAILAVTLMVLDRRGGWLDRVHYYMDAAVYPIQLAVSSPSRAWHWTSDTLAARDSLEARNAALTARNRELTLRTQRFEALQLENAQLRGLKAALPPVAERWLVAEVVNVELNSQRQRMLLNRGAHNGVFRNQAVLDAAGVLGQTISVSPWGADVILVTDPESGTPVEIERTGVRTIAVGTGDANSLALPYLPTNADVKSGDLLVTSGLGGVYPQGYPVARITEVRHDAVQPLAQITATPLARIDAVREVTLVWFQADLPAAPARDGATGNPALQPQNTPPLEPLPPVSIPRLKSPPPQPPATRDGVPGAPNPQLQPQAQPPATGSQPGPRAPARPAPAKAG